MNAPCQTGNPSGLCPVTYSGAYSGQHISGQNTTVVQGIHTLTYYSNSPGLYAGGWFESWTCTNGNLGLGIEILLDASEPNAAVDAEARAYPPRCFPGTREQYIEDITSWATASSDSQYALIYRMKGPAGAGKSAIAQTCTEQVKKQGKLGAAFFFSIDGCNNHRRFFTTIAYQLSTILPEYKQTLNDRILNDRTIISKNIASQFEELIVEPLRQVKELGKEVGMRTIFVDGLDECQSRVAQSEIIELIATSARDRTTPFRWALFSRAELHIEATCSLDFIIPLIRTVELPISREADPEIRLYLEGGFKNIIHRQNLSFSMPWPPPEAIQKLIDAAAGLYAYPATVLRFVESSHTEGPKKALAAVLDVISQSNSHPDSLSPFADLDAFYMLIMKRIPDHILPSIQLLLLRMLRHSFDLDDSYYIAIIFNLLGLSGAALNAMRKYLHAVLHYAPQALELGSDIDVTRPCYDQRHLSDQEIRAIVSSLGSLRFYHKSFHDFLRDPDRSFTFCICTPEMETKLLERELEAHLDLVTNFKVNGTELVLEADMPASVMMLSFPLQDEYSNSYIRCWVYFIFVSSAIHTYLKYLVHYYHYTEDKVVQKLSEVDYRAFLLLIDLAPIFPFNNSSLLHRSGDRTIRKCKKSRFSCELRVLFPDFLSSLKLLKKLGIIKPYPPTFTSRLKRFFRARTVRSVQSGLYTLGQGEKAVFWYWEFDMKSEKLYEFWAVDLEEAMEIFQSNKDRMWSDDWTDPTAQPSERPQSSISSDEENQQSVAPTLPMDGELATTSPE